MRLRKKFCQLRSKREEIDTGGGSTDNHLAEVLRIDKVEIALLRANYLE